GWGRRFEPGHPLCKRRRHSQVVRQRSAKPPFPGSNPGAASAPLSPVGEKSLFLPLQCPVSVPQKLLKPAQEYTTLLVLAIPGRNFVEFPRLTLDLDHLGGRVGVEYLPALFSARPPN